MIYISSNNVRHPVPKTFITIHYTLPNYASRHFTLSHLNFTHLHFIALSFGLTPRDMVEREDFSPQIPEITYRSSYVGFVVKKIAKR